MLPLVLEPEQLEQNLGRDDLLIVDLCRPQVYNQDHIPGAVHLEYARLVLGQTPAPGLLPTKAELEVTFSGLGLTPQHHVVAYDDEGGGHACRLLWTLDVIGHKQMSLLNGGLHAWVNEGHPQSAGSVEKLAGSDYSVSIGEHAAADRDYIMQHLDDPQVILLDARTPNEYAGIDVRARQGGHIPGAVNLNWLETLDQSGNLRLKPDDELRDMLDARQVTPDNEVITYCQTHHRSSHSYIMLKHLGYPRIKGYAGSWSEWGNHPDTPTEK